MLRFQIHAWLAVLLGTVWSMAAQAGDPAAGKVRAAMCVTCHGPLGLSQFPNAPHLAGQPAIYTQEQLRNYRSGKRHNEMMNVIAQPLSDQEIKDLAAWYASIRIAVAGP